MVNSNTNGNTFKSVSASRIQAQGYPAMGRARSLPMVAKERTANPRSSIPTHKVGSFTNLNVSNASKRRLLEDELDKIREEAAYVTTVEQSDELMTRKSNVTHQLNLLDAAEGNAPMQYDTTSTTAQASDVVNHIPDINALGAGGGMLRADKRLAEELQGRYQINKADEEAGIRNWEDDTKHINGQAQDGLGSLSFGQKIDEKYSTKLGRAIPEFINKKYAYHPFGTVANAGCESIAVYNTLVDLDKEVPLSQIIYDTERYNYMLWNGWFGTAASKVDDVLKLYGVESKEEGAWNIQRAADKGLVNEGQIYIASAYNDWTGIFSGIHTFEIVYLPTQNPNEPWLVYNLDSGTTAVPKATFIDVFSGAPIHIHKIQMR